MPAPLVIAGLAAAGFVKGGGLGGIIGSGKRKREEQAAEVERRERLYDYENFDFNQDVGDIYNPYAQIAKKQQEFEQENLDKSQARLINQHERAGVFGATTGVVSTGQDQARRSAQRITSLRQQGAQFVEQQRQSRIAQRYGQAQTLLARSEHRLAAARRARQKATESLVKGIGAGVAAGVGAAGAGAGASFGARLKASGLIDSSLLPGDKKKGGGAAGLQALASGVQNTAPGLGVDTSLPSLTSLTGGAGGGGGLTPSVDVGQGAFGGPFDIGGYMAPDESWSYGSN